MVLTDVAVPARPFGVAFAFSKVNVEDSVSGTIRQTLIQGLIAPGASRAHPANVTNAGGVLATAMTIAARIYAISYKKSRGFSSWMESKSLVVNY